MKTRSQLRHCGMWPDAQAQTVMAPELTLAARRLAEAALEELGRFGVHAALDKVGRVRFRATRTIPPAVKFLIEIHGDLIEAALKRDPEQHS